jgi:hypothetical protein
LFNGCLDVSLVHLGRGFPDDEERLLSQDRDSSKDLFRGERAPSLPRRRFSSNEALLGTFRRR